MKKVLTVAAILLCVSGVFAAITSTGATFTLNRGTTVVGSGYNNWASCQASAKTDAAKLTGNIAYTCTATYQFSIAGTSKPPVVAPTPPIVVPPTPPAPTDGYVNCAVEGATCVVQTGGNAIFGIGAKFTPPVHVTTSFVCDKSAFGNVDPVFGTVKNCWLKADPPTMVDHSKMIYIDNSKIPPPVSASDKGQWGDPFLKFGDRIQPVPKNPDGTIVSAYVSNPSDIGAFREPCNFAKMIYDDPIVYPGKPGVSHLHTVFGAFGFDAFTTVDNVRSPTMLAKGSTCAGGSLNNSVYWVPAMIDTKDGTPLKPTSVLTYYKGSYAIPNNDIQPLPIGLRMITGDAKNTNPSGASHTRYICNGPKGENPGWSSSITAAFQKGTCGVGADFDMEVQFPVCWDGKNLDSANHNSHMADPESYGPLTNPQGQTYYAQRCPASHPVHIPQISYNVHYAVKDSQEVNRWRLSSDMYDKSLPAGLSGHGDYLLGWDPTTMNRFVSSCLQKNVDGHASLTCDGNVLY